MDWTNAGQLSSLRSEIRYLESEWFPQYRRDHHAIAKELAGGHYGENGTETPRPYNVLSMAKAIYMMQLAAERPQVLLSTDSDAIEAAGFTEQFEAVLNRYLEDQRIEITLRGWVEDALISMGVLKVGSTISGMVEVTQGVPVPATEYFVDPVALDDFGWDIRAPSWERCSYMYDFYWIDAEDKMDLGYDPKVAEKLKVGDDDEFNETGEDRTEHLSRPEDNQMEDKFVKRIRMLDVWLQRDGVVLTLSANQQKLPPAKVTKWDKLLTKRKIGPYHVLAFDKLSGQLIPVSPLSKLRDLNEAINGIVTKLKDQAERQMTVPLVSAENAKDGELVTKQGRDGKPLIVENPEAVKEYSYGGPNAENMAAMIQFDRMFSRLGGNIDAMGNLGPQAETLGQDKMIRAGITEQMAKMGYHVMRGVELLTIHLGYHIWTDPVNTYPSMFEIPDAEISVPNPLTPDRPRIGEFLEQNFRHDPYAMAYQSPAERMGQLMQLMTTIVIPSIPMIQQQGGQVEWQEIFELAARYLSLPELKRFLTFAGMPYDPAANPGLPGSDKPRQSPVTHRTNERINRPGAVTQQQDEVLVRSLMGGNPQASEQASVVRAAG